jgi:pyruvate dehydrogenase E1 component beta subunit
MQFDAFAYPAFEQITSHIAKMRNRTLGRVNLPIVIRIPYGGGIGGVEHHCDSSEGYYAHTPGLQVVTPATPGDAYSLLREAIRNPDPVVFMEPKALYWSKEDLALPASREPFGTAAVRREGTDVTLVTYGPQVATALKAADVAAAEETGFAGVGAEVAARIGERCFHSLAAPVLRVTGLDIPYPPPMLEHSYLPGVDRILDTIARLQWDDEPDTTHLPGADGGAAGSHHGHAQERVDA